MKLGSNLLTLSKKVAARQSMLVPTVLSTLGRSIKSFVLDAICPLLLDFIVMYTSTLNIYPLLVEFDCRLYFTDLIFRPQWYTSSPPWLDWHVYLDPNPIHLSAIFLLSPLSLMIIYTILFKFDCRISPLNKIDDSVLSPQLDCHEYLGILTLQLSTAVHHHSST